MVIGAPTGIAAFNVGGRTLHSLFGLPREGLLLGGEENEVSLRDIFEAEIDEVSMVRSDVLNAIDHGLRQQRDRDARSAAFASSSSRTLISSPPVIAEHRLSGGLRNGSAVRAPCPRLPGKREETTADALNSAASWSLRDPKQTRGVVRIRTGSKRHWAMQLSEWR